MHHPRLLRIACATTLSFTLSAARAQAQAPVAEQPTAQVPAAEQPTAQVPAAEQPAAQVPAADPVAAVPPAAQVPVSTHSLAPVARPDATQNSTTLHAPPRGVGMMAGGGVALGLSIPIVVVGLLKAGGSCALGTCENSATDLTGGTGLIVVGMLGALAGSALLGYGGMRHRQWRQWRDKHPQLAPRVARSPAGTWTAGLSLRF